MKTKTKITKTKDDPCWNDITNWGQKLKMVKRFLIVFQ